MNVDIFPSKMLRWCLVCVICTVTQMFSFHFFIFKLGIMIVHTLKMCTLHEYCFHFWGVCPHIEDVHLLFCKHFKNIFFRTSKTLLAHLSRRLNVSYCDRSLSVVPPSVNFFFKRHLLNNWSKFHITLTSHEFLYDALIQNCLNGSTLPRAGTMNRNIG